jgi:hypothetical protein
MSKRSLMCSRIVSGRGQALGKRTEILIMPVERIWWISSLLGKGIVNLTCISWGIFGVIWSSMRSKEWEGWRHVARGGVKDDWSLRGQSTSRLVTLFLCLDEETSKSRKVKGAVFIPPMTSNPLFKTRTDFFPSAELFPSSAVSSPFYKLNHAAVLRQNEHIVQDNRLLRPMELSLPEWLRPVYAYCRKSKEKKFCSHRDHYHRSAFSSTWRLQAPLNGLMSRESGVRGRIVSCTSIVTLYYLIRLKVKGIFQLT